LGFYPVSTKGYRVLFHWGLFGFSFSDFGTNLGFDGGVQARVSAKAPVLFTIGMGSDKPVMITMSSQPWRSASEDVWRRTLRQIPTVYGRLVYLAQRRSPDSGLYEHHGLAKMFGEEEADTALHLSHDQTFRRWLELGLEEQKADLALYFAGLPTNRKVLVENWLRLAPYRNLVPYDASPADKELFLTDLELLLRTIRNELVS
jgi:hypothetical protein